MEHSGSYMLLLEDFWLVMVRFKKINLDAVCRVEMGEEKLSYSDSFGWKS